jgi:cytoskeletal protein RodZ
MNPGGDAGWDGPPLDIQVPDDARELERDILAYHREQRALRRRRRLRKIMPGQAGIMPLMASILAVCLVAGMMLSVFTITPTDGTSKTRPSPTQPVTSRPTTAKPGSTARQSPSASTSTSSTSTSSTSTSSTSASGTQVPSPRTSGHTRSSGAPRVQPAG